MNVAEIHAIIGSGFGLYGYLPALTEEFGASVVLPEQYRDKAASRPELVRFLGGVRWESDLDRALAVASTVVIAATPAAQAVQQG